MTEETEATGLRAVVPGRPLSPEKSVAAMLDINGEIAAKLKLAEKTIKNYVSQIYAKLNVERRSQAARLATERRLRKEQQ